MPAWPYCWSGAYKGQVIAGILNKPHLTMCPIVSQAYFFWMEIHCSCLDSHVGFLSFGVKAIMIKKAKRKPSNYSLFPD